MTDWITIDEAAELLGLSRTAAIARIRCCGVLCRHAPICDGAVRQRVLVDRDGVLETAEATRYYRRPERGDPRELDEWPEDMPLPPSDDAIRAEVRALGEEILTRRGDPLADVIRTSRPAKRERMIS